MEWWKLAGKGIGQDDGQSLAEYAIILALIAVLVIAAVGAVGKIIGISLYDKIVAALKTIIP